MLIRFREKKMFPLLPEHLQNPHREMEPSSVVDFIASSSGIGVRDGNKRTAPAFGLRRRATFRSRRHQDGTRPWAHDARAPATLPIISSSSSPSFLLGSKWMPITFKLIDRSSIHFLPRRRPVRTAAAAAAVSSLNTTFPFAHTHTLS